MMKSVILVTIMVTIAVIPALACDNHIGSCEIEAWRYSHEPMMGALSIQASMTCDSGLATIRLYNDENFLGIATGFVQGHALEAVALDIPNNPPALTIKYSVDPW